MDDDKCDGCQQRINPFVNSVRPDSVDRFKMAVLSVLLAPVKLVLGLACFFMSYLVALVGMWGCQEQQLYRDPLNPWRRRVQRCTTWWLQATFYCMGFRLRVKGRRQVASGEGEAPILVLAPHSSFMDIYPCTALASPSFVSKSEVRNIPIYGKIMSTCLPVYVWRDDPDSRQKTLREIVRRASSGGQWPPVAIFPEGTCTNRRALITFKVGAFTPAVPVQPVCISYPNRLDTVTWGCQGPTPLQLVWLTLTQLRTYCQVEFLPVYTPTPEERQNPQLFANNVRKAMARALKVPTVDYSYTDMRLVLASQKLNLPAESGLIEFDKMRAELSLDLRTVERDWLPNYAKMANPVTGLVCRDSLATYLGLPAAHTSVASLYTIYDPEGTGVVTFEQFVRGRCALKKEDHKIVAASADRWQDAQDRLGLTSHDRDRLHRSVEPLLGSHPETQDFLDVLCASVPEWRWIVANGMSSSVN